MSRVGYHTDRKERQRKWVLQHTSFALQRLRKIVSMTSGSHPTLANIDIVVCRSFGLDVADLQGDSLWCIDVAGRQIAMSLAYMLTPHSFQEIANHFHRFDHTVILCAYRKYGAALSELCKAYELPIFKRIKGIRTSMSMVRNKVTLLDNLEALVRWKDGPTTADDIFPDLISRERIGILLSLRNRGYVSSKKDYGELWWQITPAGLDALEQLKESLELKEAA